MSSRAIRLLIALFGLLVIAWAAGALCRSALTTVDLRAVHDVAADRTPAQVTAARGFSWVGSGYVVFPVTLVCCAILYARGLRRRALAVGIGTLGAAVLANVDKLLVGRPRPPVHHLQVVTGSSFPSGHATQSTALLVALLAALFAAHPPRWLKIAAAAAAGLLVVGVAASRIYLGVHYPSDVIFGLLLGATCSLVASHYVTAPGRREWEWVRVRQVVGGTAAVVVGGLGVVTAATLLDRFSWIFEATTLFNLQYAALLVVATLVAAAVRRWRLAAVAAALAAINIAIIAPWSSAPPPAAAAGEPTLRIVSLNLDSTNRHFGELGPMIQRLHPDILGLTEVTPAWALSAEHASPRVQPRLLAAQPGNYGVGVLSVARPTSITAQHFPKNGPIVLVVRFRIANRPLTFLVIHLHTPFAGTVHARELRALAAARPRLGPRLIACGDFNTVPWSAQLRQFAEDAGLTDVFRGSWPQWTWPSWSWLLRTPIDHCLISRGLAVRDRRVGPNIGSDHFSLIVDIAVTALRP